MKNLVKFLKFIAGDEFRKLNFILVAAILVTFPNQNAYQSLQPVSNRPLVRQINYDVAWVAALPFKTGQTPAPPLSAKSVVVIDAATKTVIWSKNPDEVLDPASTTKLATALVALDYYRLEDILEVKNHWQEGQVIGFLPGQRFTALSLLESMLVGSANDAAEVLAQNYPGGREVFIQKMNNKVAELKLVNTHFTNPSGIEDDAHKTTAHDLAALTSQALKNPVIRGVVAKKQTTIQDENGQINFYIENTNKLLGVIPGVIGVKTGWTQNAGECLITACQQDSGEIIVVLLGSRDRFGETAKIINWVWENFSWQPIDTRYQQLPGHKQ